MGEGDTFKDTPIDGCGIEEMRKELGYIPDFGGFMLMHGGILIDETFHEIVPEDLSDFAESLSEESEEPEVCSFLHATVNDHIANFILMSNPGLHLNYFVQTLFEIHTTLNGQINNPLQIQ